MTIRIPRRLKEQMAVVAQRQGKSVNVLVQEAITNVVHADAEREQEELRRAADILAGDPEENSAEYLLAAQAEVILSDG